MDNLGTATYSPDDNKLRFYPRHRLDAEDYARVKAAGFAWAPRQQLFVAPMWTPGREDLLTEMCANGPRQAEKLRPFCTEWEDLPPGTFKESGTGVNAALLAIDYEDAQRLAGAS